MTDNGNHRVQMILPTKSVDRLHALKEATEAATVSEVIRNAIRVYEALVEQVKIGNKIIIQSRNGDMTQIRMF